MLSDQNTINDINPYVLIDFSPPGSISAPYKFSNYSTPPEEQPAMWENDEKSVMCDYGKRVGFGGSNMCENPKPNCPMSRLLLPERVIQYEDGRVNTELAVDKTKEIDVVRQRQLQRDMYIKLFILMIILVTLVYLLIR